MANEVNILVNTDTKGSADKFQKISKAVAGVSLAVAGAGLALVKIGDDFTKASRNITAGTGATGKELEALKKEFKDVAAAVPQDFDTVSKAIADVKTELDLSGDALEQTTKRFLDLSRITGTEVAPLIKQVSDSMDMFGVSSDQAAATMDSFAKASQLTGVPIGQLTSRVTEFGPVLRNLGLGMNDTIALMGQLEGAGISASRVMPGLNAAMRRMAASGTQDMSEGLQEAMRNIKGATSDTDALNMATDLFGAEGAQRMSVAIRDGTVDIAAMSETLANAQGTVDDMNEGTLTTGERFRILGDKVKIALEPMAGIMAALGPIVIILPSMIAGIAALSGMMSGLSLATMGAAIKSGVLTVATGIQTAASWLGAAAATALNLALSPIGLIIIGIALAVGAAILIWKNWDKIVAVLTETWEKFDSFLSEKFPATWAFIKDYISTVIEFWKEIFQGFVALFKGDWDGAIEHFKGAFSVVFDFFKEIFDKIWGFFDDWMTNKFGAGWETLKSIVSGVVDSVGEYFGGLWEVIKGIWDLIVGIFTGDTDKITDAFKTIINGIIQMFNAVIGLFNKIKFEIPEWIPGVGGKSFGINIPTIPQLAEGGIVRRPTLAVVGESGPEAVVPLSGGAGGGVTVNVMMPEGGTVIMDDEQTMQRFSDFITREIRQVLRTQAGF